MPYHQITTPHNAGPGTGMINFGTYGEYEWLVADEDLDLLQLCPDIALGKYVAVTSIDSGEFLPEEHERAAGWEVRGGIAYSPKVLDTQTVPRSREAYDEWYVFANPVDLGTSQIVGHLS